MIRILSNILKYVNLPEIGSFLYLLDLKICPLCYTREERHQHGNFDHSTPENEKSFINLSRMFNLGPVPSNWDK